MTKQEASDIFISMIEEGLRAGIWKTRREAASCAGITPGRLSQIESGETGISAATWLSIAEALGYVERVEQSGDSSKLGQMCGITVPHIY